MNFLEAEAKKKELRAQMLELWAWMNRGEPIYSNELSQKMEEMRLAFEAYFSILENQMMEMGASVPYESPEFRAVLQRELGEILTLIDGMMPTKEDRIQ